MKLKLLAAAALAAAAMGAQATTADLGPIGTTAAIAPVQDNAGAIDDFLTFSVAGAGKIASTTVANNLANVLQIAPGSTVSLFSGSVGTGSMIGSYGFDGTTGSMTHVFDLMSAGSYYYEVKGMATGSQGGLYMLSTAVVPVPEPESYALLLAGLGVVGTLYRRRKGR